MLVRFSTSGSSDPSGYGGEVPDHPALQKYIKEVYLTVVYNISLKEREKVIDV